jgi:uncharacterized membrane protein
MKTKNLHFRIASKTITYRCAGSALTAGIVYISTHNWRVAAAAGLSDGILKMPLYYVHEWLWGPK